MNSNTNLYAGTAAALLAILFPLYWGVFFGTVFGDFDEAFKQDLMSLDAKDALFFLIGMLEVGIYLHLSKCLSEYFSTSISRYLLIIMAGLVALLHLTVAVDIYLMIFGINMSGEVIEAVATTTLVVSHVLMTSFAVMGIAFSIVALIHNTLPPLLKAFVSMILLICLLQITFVLSFLNIFLFPASLVVLAVYFLREKQEVEVV